MGDLLKEYGYEHNYRMCIVHGPVWSKSVVFENANQISPFIPPPHARTYCYFEAVKSRAVALSGAHSSPFHRTCRETTRQDTPSLSRTALLCYSSSLPRLASQQHPITKDDYIFFAKRGCIQSFEYFICFHKHKLPC